MTMTDENVYDEECPPGLADHRFEPTVNEIDDVIDIDPIVPAEVRNEMAALTAEWREVEKAAHRLFRRTDVARDLAERYIVHATETMGLGGDAEDGIMDVLREMSGFTQLDRAVINVNECAALAMGEEIRGPFNLATGADRAGAALELRRLAAEAGAA